MDGWKLVRAEDFIDFNPSESLPRNSNAKKVAMERLQPFTRDITGFEIARFTGGTKFRNGDTLMARITPCLENGKVAQVSILEDDEIGFGSTEFIVLRAKPGVSDKDFVYYLSISPILRDKAIKSMVGSSGRQRVQQGVLNNTEFYSPPLQEQIEIGRILRAFDDKIENNKKINHRLEQIAQAIFKSWFVDFEPFTEDEFFDCEMGPIPAGWQVTRIGDLPVTITDYVANGSFASLKENVTLLESPSYAVFVRNVDLKAGSFGKYVGEDAYGFLSKSALFGGEVIISNVGDVGSVFLCPYLPQPMTLGNNIIMLTANESKTLNYFFYLLFKYSYGAELIRTITGGSAQPKFNKTDFRSLCVIMPSATVMNKFLEAVECLFQRQTEINQENARLAELRDTLLPRLMSGELSVGGIDDVK